ncbi:MAG: MBL fold metallo-hydrolase [Firmicutes bacterium]|jgi:metallo-beta-lactamase family protein|nr:MBL fold metallo-hydrolase [Bacillota bacterium]
MKIQFLGATNLVTGSCYHVKTSGKEFLVDCGQFQGSIQEEKHNLDDFKFNPESLDFIILTHSHIDHCGRIPKLVKEGFHGKIYCTYGTRDLCEILLKDSGIIHETNARNENEKRKKAGLDEIEAYYTQDDAIIAMQYFYPLDYEKFVEDGNISFTLNNAGHLLGAATADLKIMEDNKESKIAFSGDLGTNSDPLLQAPVFLKESDYVFIESTYGNRIHKDVTTRAEKLCDIIIETIDKGGTVLIPSFSVGRTQEILYELNHHVKDPEKIKKLREISFYVDSPLAISAFNIYKKHMGYFKEEIQKDFAKDVENFLKYPNLHLIEDHQESIRLNFSKEAKVIVSASGMCDAGRIQHHLQYYLPKENTSIVFVGYQSEESLGRKILNRESPVTIGDENIPVKAQIHKINGFSGHGDQKDLLKWIKGFDEIRKGIIVIHGEDSSRQEFSVLLKDIYPNLNIEVPNLYDEINF